MDLRALQTFTAVAETGAITAAAARLNTVQSAVSTRLAALERNVGTALFLRHASGVTLTAAGLRLMPYAQRIATLVDEANHAVRHQGGQPAGPFALGAVEVIAASRLPKSLAQFSRRHPAVQMSLCTGVSEELVAEVVAGRLDAAIVAGSVSGTRSVRSVRLSSEPLALVEPRGVGAASVRHAYAFKRGCVCRAKLEAWLRSHRCAAQVMELGSVEAIIGCVAAGLGVSLLPAALAVGRAGISATPLGELPLTLLMRPGHVAAEAFGVALARSSPAG